MNQAPGQMVAHYRLISQIGAGGMGVVWKAFDTKLDREAALKFLPRSTGNLDRGSADTVFALMLDLARQRGTAFVLVTHDASLAARCQRVLHLEQGRLVG